jgi:hypothetical protein
MPPRIRLIAVGGALLVALLSLGRWLSTFLADRWWAQSVSPATTVFTTQLALLRLGLDLLAIVLATLWFVGNARAILHTGQLVPGRDRGGNPAVRRAMQARSASLWATVAGVALGILAGSGAGHWAEDVLRAATDIRYGLADPALGHDAGLYVARLPLWVRLQAFATMLLVPTLALASIGALLSGAVRVVRSRLAISDAARRHLGMLLGCLAVLIGAHQVLVPFELAAGLPDPVDAGVVRLHQQVSFVIVGVSIAVAMLSLIWASRPVHSLAAGSWLALSAALIGASYLLPVDPMDLSAPQAMAQLERFEAVAYGMSLRESDRPLPGTPFRPSIWDGPVIAALAAGDTGARAGANRFLLRRGAERRVAWATTHGTGRTEGLVVILDDSVSASGGPLTVAGEQALASEQLGPFADLPPLSVRPGAPRLEVADGSRGGVPVGGFGRRVVLAWALQSGRLLGATGSSMVGWRLTPESRLAHAAPFAHWGRPRLAAMAGRPVWVVDGLALSEAFPVARPRIWNGQRVALVRAGFIGVIEMSNGATRVFLRPGADPLASAWAVLAGDLVEPADRIPADLLPALAYPEDLLPLQASLLAANEAHRMGRDTAELVVATQDLLVQSGYLPGAVALPIVDRRTSRLHTLLEGGFRDGTDRLVAYSADSAALESPEVLARRWQRHQLVQQVRDSVVARGARFVPGAVRYAPLVGGWIAYQPMWATEANGKATLVLVGTSGEHRLSMGRTFQESLTGLRGDAAVLIRATGESGLLFEARRLLRDADSALRRGDLSGFARAFGALRSLLEGR